MTYETGTANWVVGTEAGSGRFFVYSSASAQDLIRCTGGANGGSELYAKGSGVIAFHTASSVERMRIDASGNALIGRSSQQSGGRLEVAGNIVANVPTAAPTLGTNQDMSFQLLSNTQLKILVRGTDGVTRSAIITLA